MISKLKGDNKVVGTKQVKRALNSSNVELVYVADDADRKITDEIIELCKTKQVEVAHINTMENLGKACGIDINAAVAALLY